MKLIKSILWAAFWYALIVYGIPYGLAFTDIPLLDQILTPAALQAAGILWAAISFLRHLLKTKKPSFFAGLLRMCLLLGGFAAMGWYGVTYVWPLIQSENIAGIGDAISSIAKKSEDLQFTPDVSDYGWTLQEEGLPVIAVQADLDDASISQLVDESVRTLPAWLLNQARAIYILDDASFQKALTDHSISASGLIAGFSNYSYTDSGDGVLRSCHDEEVFLRLSTVSAATTAHELTHCFDFENDITQKNENGKYHEQVQTIYSANPFLISRYGATNPSEFFAEAGSLYITDPARLQSLSPELYSIFEDLFGEAAASSFLSGISTSTTYLPKAFTVCVSSSRSHRTPLAV